MSRPLRGARAAALALALTTAAVAAPTQDWSSSVVGTEFDFILDSDPSTFTCLEFAGRRAREMPDKTRPGPLVQEAFVFVAHFEDGTRVDVAIDVDFETEANARAEALRYAPRLGKLPTALRRGVERVVVHRGEEDATAFSDVGLMVLYSDNATKRIATHDLEETIFHESVHAAWDAAHARSAEWRAAQDADGAFVTEYARENPDGEDLAESALFAYALIHHPGRIPAAEADAIMGAIPARLSFVEGLLPPEEPLFHSVGPRYPCDGSGTTFAIAREAPPPGRGESGACTVNLASAGGLSDVLSNALMHGLGVEEPVVSSFLAGAHRRFADGDALLDAAVLEFGFDRATLEEVVEEFRHCNCDHGELSAAPAGAPPAVPATKSDDAGASDLRGILRVIAALLALLLVVNAGVLAVLVRRSRAT